MKVALLIAAAGLGGLAALGCSKQAALSSPTTRRASFAVRPPRLPTIPETGPFAAGRKIFNTSGCPKCHRFDSKADSEAKEHRVTHRSSVHKDLTGVGANRTRAWILDHIRDPAIHQPDSPMPAYKKDISEKDLDVLADFLANQK